MAVYQLRPDAYEFPPTAHADPDGLLAVGGDLSVGRLLAAYTQGIFPWYSSPEPILWWSPSPRLILRPQNIKISKSMRSLFRRQFFDVTIDTQFQKVMTHCQQIPRQGQTGTWITPQIIQAYTALHQLGFAHSVEVWKDGELVGGLYGIAMGNCFFGESMFSRASNASKYALIHLSKRLHEMGFQLIDCQTQTQHLISMGAEEVSRLEFEALLEGQIFEEGWLGNWQKLDPISQPLNL